MASETNAYGRELRTKRERESRGQLALSWGRRPAKSACSRGARSESWLLSCKVGGLLPCRPPPGLASLSGHCGHEAIFGAQRFVANDPNRSSNSIQKNAHPARRLAQPSLLGDPGLRYLNQLRFRRLHGHL